MPVSRSPSRPVSGSPAYSPDDLPVYRGGSTGAAPAPVCTITLTHDGLDAFGLEPMAVTGQTVSVTGDGTSMYGMSTGLAGVPVDWTGVRVVAKKYIDMPSAPANGLLHLVRASDLISARLFWDDDGKWAAEIRALATDAQLAFVQPLGGIEAEPAIGIDGATGDCVMFLDGTPVVDKNTPGFAQLGGLFASDSASILDVASVLALGDTYSAEIITQADKYTASYPAGTLDWCGNPLPPFNPVALPDLLAYYDIRRTDTLFEDTAGNVPVTAATDPIGRWNAVGPSGAPNLLQGTGTSRPPYQLTPTRAEFDQLDDSLSVTLPAISGGQIVIVSPAGIWIDSLTFAGGTFTLGPSTYTGGPVGLLSMLSGDVTAVYILDAPLSPGDQAAVVDFETARGSAGLITLGAELITNGTFDTDVSWWSGLNTTISWDAGKLAFTAGTNPGAVQAVSIPAGNYLAQFSASTTTLLTTKFANDGSGTAIVGSTLQGTGFTRGIISPSVTGASTKIGDVNGFARTLDDISIREVILP